MVLAGAVGKIQMLELLRLGVRGIVQKEAGTQLLLDGVRAVNAGTYWVECQSATELGQALRQVLTSAASNGMPESQANFGLTARELEVVGAIVAGLSNKEIAQ